MEYLKTLSGNYQAQKSIHPERATETGAWLLSDPAFRAWKDSRDACLLHVTGQPQCGKSVLARALVDEELVATRNTKAVLYFFFRSNQPQQTSASSAMAALLRQLHGGHQDLGIEGLILRRLAAGGHQLDQMQDGMWETILEACDLIGGNVICVIDGLEQCLKETRDSLITTISNFYSSARSQSTKLKMLVTSRSDRGIEFKLNPSRKRSWVTRINANDKSMVMLDEISTMIKSKLQETTVAIPNEVIEGAIKYISGIRSVSYRWVDLVADFVTANLEQLANETPLVEGLHEMPRSVEGFYDTILNRAQDSHLTRSLLSIVQASANAMTIREAKHALVLATGSFQHISELKDMVETDDNFQEQLQHLCGPLLKVQGNKLYFNHYTVQDYILQTEGSISRPLGSWIGCIANEEAHGCLAIACLQYLQLFESTPFPYASYKRGPHHNAIIKWIEDQDFLAYAARHWAFHYRNATVAFREEHASHVSRLLASTRDKHCSWISAYGSYHLSYTVPVTIPTLLFISHAGLDTFLQRKLEVGDGIRHSMIVESACVAARERHEYIVRMLLDHLSTSSFHASDDVQPLLDTLRISLSEAARCNRSKIFEIIIKYLSTSGYKYPLGFDNLISLLRSRDDANLQRLLDFPTGVNVTVDRLRDCLNEVASRPVAVKMILQYKLDRTQVTQATWRRLIEPVLEKPEEGIVTLLLQGFQEFSSTSWQVIMEASVRERQHEIVEILLGRYSNLMDITTYGRALLAAASAGKDRVAKQLLLFHRADLDQERGVFRKAFDAAAAKKRYPILNMLLDDRRIGSYNEISHMLYIAGVEGRVELTLILLEHVGKIGIEYSDDLHLALEGAAANGHAQTVEALLEYCIKSGWLPENCYRSALSKASRNHHKDIVELLLQQGPTQLSNRHSSTFQDTEDSVALYVDDDSSVEEPLFNEDELELDASDDGQDKDADEAMGDASEASDWEIVDA